MNIFDGVRFCRYMILFFGGEGFEFKIERRLEDRRERWYLHSRTYLLDESFYYRGRIWDWMHCLWGSRLRRRAMLGALHFSTFVFIFVTLPSFSVVVLPPLRNNS